MESDTSTPKASVTVLDPVYVNPCSYEVVVIVMRKIGHKCHVRRYGGNREWVLLVCDGIPFTLCQRIIRSVHMCSVCEMSFNGIDECTKHQHSSHNGNQVQFNREFDWVLLHPGSGHMEMNMVKGIVELACYVVWKNLAMCMKFRSETALQYAKKVSDHHKGWTGHAITRELIVPFVQAERAKSENQQNLSTHSFLKFVMKAQNPNYTFMADITFELLDAIFLHRQGVRTGNGRFLDIKAGRAKFAKLWSGRHHPLYRELEVSDTLMLERVPQELYLFVMNSDSISLSDEPSTSEGADFRLEEINSLVQHWLSHVPSTQDWKMACCNFDELSKLRSTIFQQMGIKDPKLRASKYIQNIDEEINAFRADLRDHQYLSSPNMQEVHKSMDGKVLDPELKHFCKNAREIRTRYVQSFLEYEAVAGGKKARPP